MTNLEKHIAVAPNIINLLGGYELFDSITIRNIGVTLYLYHNQKLYDFLHESNKHTYNENQTGHIFLGRFENISYAVIFTQYAY